MTLKQLYAPKERKMRIAAFMSGTGSNLRRILEEQSNSNYEVVMVFSDNSDEETCNAKKIAAEYNVPYYCSDIIDYYSSRGYRNRKNMEVRKEYDRETAKFLRKHRVDVVALCGYMSLVTGEICEKFLTVNVHPADLRILDSSGRRKYAGCMGSGCVKKVLESSGKELRSTTHIVTTQLDSGPILMVSETIPIDSDDEHELLQKLKEKGDWKIYPETLRRLADGRFWMDKEEGIAIDLIEEKQLRREKIRQMRDELSDEEVKKKSAAITEKLLRLQEYKTANAVMFYFGINKEVRTETAIKNALNEGKTIALPITEPEKGRIIPSQLEMLHQTKPGAYGIPEPAVRKEIGASEIEIVIIPGIAFDMEGNRIGYGLGYYDKFLKRVTAHRVGLAYEMQIVDKIWTTQQDVPMDKIITEERVIEVSK